MSSPPGQESAALSAGQAFRQARWQAELEKLWARLRGQSSELLCYSQVRDLLVPDASFTVGRREIPLASIVGSVERCADYTQGFLPLRDSDQSRWTRVQQAFATAKSLPPIWVYRAGDVYFVLDGNHRVSVARQMGKTHISAHVIHIQARVPLAVGDRPAGLALKRRHAQLLQATGLHETRPQADLWLTVPEQYEALQAEIEDHRRFVAAARQQEVLPKEAAADWYDSVYLPAVEEIRRGISPGKPGWTEAGMYLALRAHRAALEEALGQEVSLAVAVADLAAQLSRPLAPGSALRRLWRTVVGRWRGQP